MYTSHNSHLAASQTLAQWREQALTKMLYIGACFGGLALIPTIVDKVLDNQFIHVLFFSFLYIVILGITFIRRLGFRVRAGGLLLICFGAGVFGLATLSLLSDAGIYLFTFVTLAAMLFGRRIAIAALLLSVITMAAIFGAFLTRLLPLNVDAAVRLTSVSGLFSSWLTFGLLVAVSTTALLSMKQRLNQSLIETARAAQEAFDAQQYAQLAVQEAIDARDQAEHQTLILAQQTQALEHTQQQLRDLIATLETPTVSLSQDVLLTPIVGTLDTQRIQNLMQRLLEVVGQQQAQTVVIDITGVTTVDTQVALALVNTARALRLLGCTAVLTGVSPQVANTIIQLGVAGQRTGSLLDSIHTARSPQEVLMRR